MAVDGIACLKANFSTAWLYERAIVRLKTVRDIEISVGKLPESYCEWIEKGVTTDDSYNMYLLDWISGSEVLKLEIAPEGVLEGILPIAVFHSVDFWCLDNKNGGRVILCPHDDIVAELYAPSVEGWMYRVCLGEASDFCDEDEIVQKQLILWATLIEKSKPIWAEHIKTLAQSQAKDIGEYYGVISKQEVNDIMTKEFGSEYVRGDKVEFLNP